MFKFLLGIGFYASIEHLHGFALGVSMTIYALLVLQWAWYTFGYNPDGSRGIL